MKWRSLEEASSGSDTRPLREQLAERKALIAKYVQPEVQAIHTRAIDELRQKRLTQTVLAAGAKMPAFTLPSHQAKLVSSDELLKQGPLVVCFYRGRWCPFCVGQLEAMNLILSQIVEAGASLVAISPQTVKQSSFMADQHKLRFPLLSDAGNEVAQKFGVAYQVPQYQQTVYRSAFVNLPFANGDESWQLPIPATFIVDREGTVLYAFAEPDYTERAEPAEILAFLRS
jgi:peroxiredoxin